MEALRAFLSYSHEDQEQAERLQKALEAGQIDVIRDVDFFGGGRVHDQIEWNIAHCHVCVLLLSRASERSAWVQQEIGYSIAAHVPILPISVDATKPAALIEGKIALTWRPDVESLVPELRDSIDRLWREAAGKEGASALCVSDNVHRMERIANYAHELMFRPRKPVYALVRLDGGFTSFSIPNIAPNDEYTWQERFGKAPSMEHRNQALSERGELVRHARAAGARIIVNPRVKFQKFGSRSKPHRIRTLLEFLASADGAKVEVAIRPGDTKRRSRILVGDWFLAESVSFVLQDGYRETHFTYHSPTVRKAAEAFDQEFLRLEQPYGASARQEAIHSLEGILRALEGEPSVDKPG